MPILTTHGLRKSFGTRTLFENASVAVEEGEKVGFVGANGSGKSTFFRILAGLEPPDGGTIAVRRGASVGYLAQDPDFGPGQTIRSAVAAGRPEMVEALREYERLAERLAGSPAGADRLLARQGELMARIDALGGWNWQHEVETILTHLGLPDRDRPVEGLSGGERKRVALARVLLERPDLLLLDEPTNHLDADTTLWLEDRLLDYPGAVMLVTHDRYFLDRVVTRMIEVGRETFEEYDGGYTEYLEAKAVVAARRATESAKRDRLLEQELAWVKRSPAARTGKQKARIKRFESIRDEAAADSGPAPDLDFRFGDPPRLGRTVLEIESLSKSFGDRILIRDFGVRLRAGERIGVVGPNGAGKTTLLRIVLGLESADSGSVAFGVNTKPAYFDQARTDLDPGLSVYDAVTSEEWVQFGGRRVHARSYLERFLFPTEVHDQRVGSLSGGERNRLLLARLLLEEANLLILDEPTNDLDLTTLQVLESALADFLGCLLVVTHDRFFLDKVATGLLVFEPGGIVHRHEGGYDLYRRLKEEREAAAADAAPAKRAGERRAERQAPERPRRLTYHENRELAGMESAIMEAEAERDRLAAELAKPSLYADTPERVAPLRSAFEEVERRVEALYARWAVLEEVGRG